MFASVGPKLWQEQVEEFKWMVSVNANTCEAKAGKIFSGYMVVLLTVGFVRGKIC